jgi:hypothetical protein
LIGRRFVLGALPPPPPPFVGLRGFSSSSSRESSSSRDGFGFVDFFGAHSPATFVDAAVDDAGAVRVAVRAAIDEVPADENVSTIAATTVAEGKSMGAVPTEKAD